MVVINGAKAIIKVAFTGFIYFNPNENPEIAKPYNKIPKIIICIHSFLLKFIFLKIVLLKKIEYKISKKLTLKDLIDDIKKGNG